MPDLTSNYNLKKPLGNENYNVADQNGNMDIIDAALKANSDTIATKETPAGAQAKADAVQTNLTTHLAATTQAHGGIVPSSHLISSMPHQFTDGGTTYRWGIAMQDGELGILWEEVV